MEIKYTKEKIDKQLFGKNKICGLLDKDGTFLENTFKNIEKIKLPNIKVSHLFKLKIKRKYHSQLNDILSELELEYITKKKIKTLSTSELIKVETICSFLTNSKAIILSHIDKYLTPRDLTNMLKILKNYVIKLDKNVILETNQMDNILSNVERYIIIEDENIVYLGERFKEIPCDYSIKEFVTLANKKKAKLDLYKDDNDLLKAIYRSVKK